MLEMMIYLPKMRWKVIINEKNKQNFAYVGYSGAIPGVFLEIDDFHPEIFIFFWMLKLHICTIAF